MNRSVPEPDDDAFYAAIAEDMEALVRDVRKLLTPEELRIRREAIMGLTQIEKLLDEVSPDA